MAAKLLTAKFKSIKKFFKKDFRVLFPQLYIIGILVGFVLTLLFAVFPQLVMCSQIFGDQLCTPTGIFVGLFVSLPGYLIAGNLFSILPALSVGVSFVIVIITSIAFYYLLGLLLDKIRQKSTSKSSLFIVASFIVLLLFLLFLLAQLR